MIEDRGQRAEINNFELRIANFEIPSSKVGLYALCLEPLSLKALRLAVGEE